MVTLAEERLKRGRKAVFATRAAAAADRERAPTSRRSCAAPAPEGRADRGRVDSASSSNSATNDAILEFRQRRGACALQPGRRGDARSHHPHQELAADRAARRKPASSTISGRRRARRWRTSSASTGPISSATTRAPAASRSSSIRCRASCWCRASACSGSAARKGCARRGRLAEAAIETITGRRSDRPLPVDRARPTCSTWNTGRSNRPSSAPRQPKPLAGQIVAITGAGGAIGAATAKAFAAAGAEVALLDVERGAATEKRQGDRRRRACGALRRDRRGLGARGLRPRWSRPSAALDIVVSNAGARLAGPHRRGRRRRYCARASS